MPDVSTHKHLQSLPHEDGTYNEQSVLKSFAAKAAMNYPLAAPAGTSGWFLGSMGQWDLFIREFCEITEEAEEIHETDPQNIDFAASIPVSLGTHFVSAGYDDPFADTYDDYGFWTSTEVNTLFAWGIFFNTGEDEDSDGDDEIWFARFTKGQGLHILPFLAF